MDKLMVLLPGEPSERLNNMLKYSIEGYDYEIIKYSNQIESMDNRRILFAVELGNTGINTELYKMLEKIISNKDFLENSVGSVIINSESELFTRNIARKIILYANMAGCIFPGRPLSEATGSLGNLNTYRKVYDMSLEDVSMKNCRKVVEQLMNFNIIKYKKPNILILHASDCETSNTIALWKMVKNNLIDYNINEIHIKNGSVIDCKGCMYKECKHYSESNSCFYGGIMVEELYPAIISCDVLIMLCPNYNDSIGADMTAVINRLTALFRKFKFYEKYVYSIIVSGHSGSDILAEQLISALNINKTFILPPKFALMETANDIGDIEKIENIGEKAAEFAKNIKNCVIN